MHKRRVEQGGECSSFGLLPGGLLLRSRHLVRPPLIAQHSFFRGRGDLGGGSSGSGRGGRRGGSLRVGVLRKVRRLSSGRDGKERPVHELKRNKLGAPDVNERVNARSLVDLVLLLARELP